MTFWLEAWTCDGCDGCDDLRALLEESRTLSASGYQSRMQREMEHPVMGTTTDIHPVPLLETIGADELVAKQLPPIPMVVGDVIPAGLLLLAGDPKAGKSLLLQHLAISVACGTMAWNAYEVKQGDVLYIANEGGERSFRDRVVKMLEGASAPSRLRITETRERLGGRLEAQLEAWMVSVDEPRLIVLDTYSSVAPDTRGINRHQEDYNALAGLASMLTAHPDVLMVVIHHTNKGEQTDVMHRISGSQGMTAATDGNAVLARHTASNRCTLSVRPRNAAESDLVLERHPENLKWTVVSENERDLLSDSRKNVMDWLQAYGEAATSKQVCEGVGMSAEATRQTLARMTKDGQVRKEGRGLYISATIPSQPSQLSQTD